MDDWKERKGLLSDEAEDRSHGPGVVPVQK